METTSTESKCVRKSTPQQLNAMVEHMELNPEFARGAPVFGSSRQSLEEQWRKLAEKLNSLGPPMRTAVEWKKTWADLKSRTKKKIADNRNSMLETGGGVFRFNPLTQLEEAIDRTLFLSTAAAPKGKTYGPRESNVSCDSVDNYFVALVDTPPRSSQTIAVVTPNRHTSVQQHAQHTIPPQCTQNQSTNSQRKMQQQSPPQCSKQQKNRQHDDSETEVPCSSAKKRRTVADDQLSLIRRQLRVRERTAAAAEKQSEAAIRIAVAVEKQAEAANRSADAMQKILMQITAVIEKSFQN